MAPRPPPGGGPRLAAWIRRATSSAGSASATPAVVTGSHIDTVPRGGPLDGALGVLAGLECLRTVAASGAKLPRALEVAAFTDEEGRFYGFFGSRAMTGSLDRTLGERLADPSRARAAGGDAARGLRPRAGARGAPGPRRDRRVRRAPHRAGAVARGRGGADRRRRGHRRDPPLPADLRGPARPCRHDADGSPAGRLPHRGRVCDEEPRAGGAGRPGPRRHDDRRRRRPAGRAEHRARARGAAAGAARRGPGCPRPAGEPHPPGGAARGAGARPRARGGAPHAGRAGPDVRRGSRR